MSWSQRLSSPIALADGRVLVTLGDARAMLLAMPAAEQTWLKFQRIADFLTTAALANNANLTMVLTGRIFEVLREPPRGTVRLVGDADKPPAS